MNRILVVDDAATIRLYHRKILGDAGWHTDEATNGVEALECVHRTDADTAYDLFVVDINMPRMDGYTFLRELRRLPPHHQAPVLMVSTEAKPTDARSGLEAGANAYLVKPSRPEELVLSAALLLGDPGRARAAAARIGATGGQP